MASHTSNSKNYNMKLIDTLYNQVPAFTDVFDEETWYIFVACFVAGTFLVAFILSRFITLKPVE
ncbi:uncharacterized protein LOC117233504 [Bombus vosnesenskii]|uniref:Uncharacterized protein LOC117233504 n=4 Tax=Bombus TaxID=28641 RepID=A0A6J3K9F4_9HYME|nr:uncharacterized protein LOC105681825 [Bombus impatiens]XP_033185736.1 uncharacterized protein LOC117154668 [Bombus vancouverensis nearcticus]XP_033318749.1 uncharacterized protein LOC117216276 [Bombus bifarius]XP_033349748.1 uncharacterized protein LOC117233504 [Bombus vosnesenskii]XP_043598060.1 uncharacterized protein LOC122574473 [Bombus pyrosoma]XP_048267465.1 uncharacterized protein LOC125386212 [Bombus terrestris]XP_050488560.1 uncharacterized protein LOC126872529 [Bombus huntii]XP_